MFSPFLGIVTWLAFMGMCQGSSEHANLSPLSIVYTVYPYYDSETLLGILKAEEPHQLSGNIVPLGHETEIRVDRNGGNTEPDESTRDSNNRDSRNDSNESGRQRNERVNTEITYWPPVQRGAAPKPRLGRAPGVQSANLKNTV